jgi:hypothetical protein
MKATQDNVFDVVEALHYFLSVSHEGQFSTKYELLSLSPFNPGMLWSESEYLAEPAPEYMEIETMTDAQLRRLMSRVLKVSE